MVLTVHDITSDFLLIISPELDSSSLGFLMVHVGKGAKKILLIHIVNYRDNNIQIICTLISYFISYYRHSIHHHQYKPGYKTYQKVGISYSPLYTSKKFNHSLFLCKLQVIK